jgi:hypothetical protein
VSYFPHADVKELAEIFRLLVSRELTSSELEFMSCWVNDPKHDYTTAQSVIDWLYSKPARVSVPEKEWVEAQYLSRLAKLEAV